MSHAMTAMDAARYIATNHHRATAGVAGLVTWNFGMAVETATGDGGLGVLAQLGVGGIIVAFLLYMLRRSDGREASDRKVIEAVEEALVSELRDQIDRLQRENLELRHRTPGTRTRKEDR